MLYPLAAEISNWALHIDDEALYDVVHQPQELDCGSLVDDFDFVSAAHKDPDQAIPLVLMHVAPLLKALSRAVPTISLRCLKK